MGALSRRDFLHDSAIAAAVAAAGLTSPRTFAEEPKEVAKKGDVNDRLNVAIIGVNSRGNSHVGGMAGKNNCVVTTICDCDEAVIGRAMRSSERAQGKAPKYEKELRRV